MGEIRVKAHLENSSDSYLCQQGKLGKRKVRAMEIDAIVDTGAVMVLLPQEVVEKLGLEIVDSTIVALADDRRIRLNKAGPVLIEICGRRMVTACLVGPAGSEPLVGQLVMEELDLIPDPARRTLGPRPESPYSATLKLKELAAA